MLILKTVAKIHILSFMKDIIGAKLSSIEDKMCKKAFIGGIFLSQNTLFGNRPGNAILLFLLSMFFIVENHDR